MRQGLGLRIGKVIGALAVVAGLAAGCAGDGDGDGEAARQRLSSADAAGGSGEAAAGSGETGGGDQEPEELDDVVVLDGPVAAVDVRDNTFNEENIQVPLGTRVVWTNNGRQDHDIVPERDGWGVEPADFTPDALYEHVFDEPGTYRYYCSLHGTADAGMTGAVVVTE
jgi:plastocyanin